MSDDELYHKPVAQANAENVPDLGKIPKEDYRDPEGTDHGKDKPNHGCDWDTIQKIPYDAFKSVVVLAVAEDRNAPSLDKDHCRISGRKSGAAHLCTFIEGQHADGKTRTYVVSVPSCGTNMFWKREHAFTLQCEAETMKYIGLTTKVPIPKVYGHSAQLDNELKAPYIVMEALQGDNAWDIWKRHCTIPSDETLEQTRQTFLKSLAITMAELTKIPFTRPGFLIKADPLSLTSSGKSSIDYWEIRIRKTKPPLDDMMRNIFLFALKTESLSRSVRQVAPNGDYAEPETFLLTHVDLDLNNILIDKEGKVTGIIDWTGCHIWPRCLGPTTLPIFLRGDFRPNYSVSNAWLMPWAIDHYRQCYGRYMDEATQKDEWMGDSHYTLRSGWFWALSACLGQGPIFRKRFAALLFSEIPSTRALEISDFPLHKYDWGEVQNKMAGLDLQEEIRKVFDV